MEEIKVIELIIDEENEISGIDAISIVDDPAIQEDFIMLSSQEVKLAEVDKEKKILMGPALIPNKKIYRKTGNDEYYIYFSEDTVRKASELFLTKGYQNNATLEHDGELEGLSVVESWIIDDTNQDKSRKYGFDLPNGTWMVSMKVYDESLWSNYVKTGKVKGFSIEGHFADAMERPKEQIPEQAELEALAMLEELADAIDTELETYSDYPDAVKNNAKNVLEYVKENGWGSCGTPIGKRRAAQISKGSNLSVSTIKRMRSFLLRHAKDLEVSTSYSDGCGKLMYDAWGGKAGLRWATSKLKELGEIELESMVISDDMAIIDDRLAYATKELAEKAAQDIGCEGHHTHDFEDKTWYMPCEKHKLESMAINEDFAIIDDRLGYATQEKAEEMAKNIGCEGFHTHDFKGKTWYMPCEQHKLEELQKCPKGYKKVYGKCVKMAEVGPRGGVKSSPKAPKSDTPNPRPKGEGSAKGDASGKTGAKVSQKDRASLQKKADEFNEKYKGKLGYGVTVGVLSSVFQRGLGAFNTSRSPVVKSASQWAFARVNAFLYLVKNGRPQNAKYTTDYDLLPKKHPKSSK